MFGSRNPTWPTINTFLRFMAMTKYRSLYNLETSMNLIQVYRWSIQNILESMNHPHFVRQQDSQWLQHALKKRPPVGLLFPICLLVPSTCFAQRLADRLQQPAAVATENNLWQDPRSFQQGNRLTTSETGHKNSGELPRLTTRTDPVTCYDMVFFFSNPKGLEKEATSLCFPQIILFFEITEPRGRSRLRRGIPAR